MRLLHRVLPFVVAGWIGPQPVLAMKSKVELLEIVYLESPGAPSGSYDVSIQWRSGLITQTPTLLDAGAVVGLDVNGVPLASVVVPILYDPVSGPDSCVAGCTGTCGTATVDGVAVTLDCGVDSCFCWTPAVTTPLVTGQALVVGDSLSVSIVPLPTADPFTPATGVQTFGIWNRRIESVDVTPAGGGMFDLRCDWRVTFSGESTLPLRLNTELEVIVASSAPAGRPGGPGTVSRHGRGDCPANSCCVEACCCCCNGCGSCPKLQDILSDSAFSQPCGSVPPQPCGVALIDSIATGLVCDPDTALCLTPLLTGTASMPLLAGDSVALVLFPAAGSAPEVTTEDDVFRFVFVPTAVPTDLPQTSLLLQPASPNPAVHGTTLRCSLPRAGWAKLTVFDSGGRRVAGLVDAFLDAGEHAIPWSGRDDAGVLVSSGVYFARLEFDGERRARRIVLIQ